MRCGWKRRMSFRLGRLKQRKIGSGPRALNMSTWTIRMSRGGLRIQHDHRAACWCDAAVPEMLAVISTDERPGGNAPDAIICSAQCSCPFLNSKLSEVLEIARVHAHRADAEPGLLQIVDPVRNRPCAQCFFFSGAVSNTLRLWAALRPSAAPVGMRGVKKAGNAEGGDQSGRWFREQGPRVGRLSQRIPRDRRRPSARIP